MNRAILRLCLGSLLITLSACGIEGSGITDRPIVPVAISSAGAVTELGSIIVNGVRYDVAGALITIDGQPASESDLKVGSVVIVEGTISPDGTSGRATRVTAGNIVAGKIDFVAITNDSFTLLGQTVEVDAATVIENAIEGQALGGLTVGSDIQVSGFADSSGTISARRIARRPPETPLLVTGYVSALDTNNFRFAVNGAIVDYTDATLVGFGSEPLDGAPVRVAATVVDGGGTIIAEEVAYRDLRMPGAAGNAAALQGWVTRFASPSDFDVDGRRVVATTEPTTVSLDTFVTVDGKITTDGAVDLEALLRGGAPKVWVTNRSGTAIQGAVVMITAGATQYQATTDANGIAAFPTITTSTGWATFSITAPGYETETFIGGLRPGEYYGITLAEEGLWAIGTTMTLAARFIDRASDGSTMRFSIDVAVIDEQSEAIQTLSSADFSIVAIDCGWGGGRDCASDANGNHTGNWAGGGHPQTFLGLQQPMARRPYVVEILAVRSDREYWRTSRPYWETLAPALKPFVAEVAGNDSLSLSSVQFENGVATRTVLGPFTNDGSIYFNAIDALGLPAGHDWPPMVQGLRAAIIRVANARDAAGSIADANVLVVMPSPMSVAELNAVADLARQLGVRVSTADGTSEIARHLGGFVTGVYDPRQFPMAFGAVDRALAGAMPFYRMEFELRGEPGTFVAGGNARVNIRVDLPTSFPETWLGAGADIAIP